MKTFKFKSLKKYISAILAMAILACMFCVSPVSAESVTVNRFGAVEGSDGVFKWKENGREVELNYFHTGEAVIENQLYCIDHTAPLNNGSSRDEIDCSATSGSEYWMSLSNEARYGVITTLLFGFNGKDNKVPEELASGNPNISTMDYLAATQLLIWEYTAGYRTTYNNCTNYIYYNVIKNRPAGEAYLYILEQTANHTLRSSFLSEANNPLSAQSHQFKWNEEAQRYEIRVTDLNGFDFDWKVLQPDNVAVERNGSEYIFSAERPESTTIVLTKELKTGLTGSDNEYALFTYGGPGGQELIRGKINPFKYFMNVTTEMPTTLTITKSSDDGNVEDFEFVVSGANCKTPLHTFTDEDGIAELWNLKAGTYVISEVQKSLAYRIWQPITIQIQGGMPEYEAFANNETAYGTVIVKKTCESGSVKGFDFTLSGKVFDADGDEFDSTKDFSMTETTDANGEARFYVPVNKVVQGDKTYLASPEGFTITEAESPVYNPMQPITGVFVTDRQDTEVEVHNTLKKSDVIINVECEDNLVEGMEYELSGFALSGDEVVLSGSTDANGRLVFKDVPVSDSQGYLVREVNVPERYIAPEDQTIAVKYGVNTEVTFVNLLRSVSILISKVSDVGAPVQNALLAVYDSSNTKLYEARTDRAGMFRIPALKVSNSYTVKELEAPQGYKLNSEPIAFSINASGAVSGTVVLVNERETVATPTPAPTLAPTPEPTLAPEPTVPPTPQTGDNSNFGTWVAITGVTATAAAVTLLFARRKKNEDN